MGKNVLKLAGAALGAYFAPTGFLASSFGAMSGAAAAGALSQPAPANIAPPAAEPVKTMPSPDSEAVRDVRKKSIKKMLARKGRASTILTSDTAVSDALGG